MFMKKEVAQFGKKLREIRLEKKMSQGDVAKILDVHRSYISGLERGARNPSLLTAQKIAKALGVKTSDLIDYE
jgi:transcriptional regulator with XRE-family HTH domain